jgi:TetR/AcrR family transcriptional regulator, mexJK operon transcriptional repressor
MEVDAGGAMTSKATSPRPRGRPQLRTDDETRKIILAAATGEFLERGYGQASTAAISCRAGVSKRTIYQLFRSKAELLESIMVTRRQAFLLSIDMTVIDTQPLEKALEYILGRLADMIMSEESLGLYRLITAEGLNFTEIARAFYQHGPAKSVALLAEILGRLQKRDDLEIADTAEMAGLLISMLSAEPMRMAALGLGVLPSLAEKQARVTTIVNLFLNGCRPKG